MNATAGDFKIDHLKYNTNNKYAEFLNQWLHLVPFILQPTRISKYSSTVIDNIYGNNSEQNSLW